MAISEVETSTALVPRKESDIPVSSLSNRKPIKLEKPGLLFWHLSVIMKAELVRRRYIFISRMILPLATTLK